MESMLKKHWNFIKIGISTEGVVGFVLDNLPLDLKNYCKYNAIVYCETHNTRHVHNAIIIWDMYRMGIFL